jgi:PTS system mannitol-specific IIC component
MKLKSNLRRKNMNTNFKVYVQKFGRFLSGMVMPNIGAFIAWGLITALFISSGWIPNEKLASLVDPMIFYMLPILIGYTGGKLVYGTRGAVLGVIATLGVIVGSDIPMFMGAMIMGPLGAYTIKKFDKLLEGKIKAGFEMLVNNFSAGIIGGGLAILSLLVVGPVVTSVSDFLGNGVDILVNAKLLPITSILIEPAKILFLNNAINHGVLTPLGLEQATVSGQSILFLLETNPGPGLGVLLAFWVFGKGMSKQSAPGAVVIHFFGGIHEIYFPYVLMKPALLLAVIAGGATGVLTFMIFGAGLVGAASPGSIIAILTVTARGSYLGVILGVTFSAVVSFLVSSVILKMDRSIVDNYSESVEKVAEMKLESKGLLNTNVQKVIFACDAGMGSSAMGATTLKSKFRKAGIKLDVTHCSIDEIPSDADIVITHKDLLDRAKNKVPNAQFVGIENFLGAPEYDQLVNQLKK